MYNYFIEIYRQGDRFRTTNLCVRDTVLMGCVSAARVGRVREIRDHDKFRTNGGSFLFFQN